MKKYFIYHAFCADGFGSAWAFYKKFGTNVTYIPVSHGDGFPEIDDNSSLVIADFSFPREVLISLEDRFKDILLIDHHVTAKRDLEGIPYAEFDMGRSGAVLVWKKYFPNLEVPRMLEYVEDRDLWNFKLPSSQEINSYIATQNMDFTCWDKLSENIENNFEETKKSGESILRREEQLIQSICHNARLTMFAELEVPVVNTSVLHSDVGHTLLEKFPNSSFAIIWHQKNSGEIKASFRSRGDFDVSILAKEYGGGGHKSAAGCLLPNIP